MVKNKGLSNIFIQLKSHKPCLLEVSCRQYLPWNTAWFRGTYIMMVKEARP